MSVQLVSDEKIAETSSKGNQEKWLDSGVWYKLDQFGYEALAETLVSQLLCRSNIEQDTPFRFVRYDISRVIVHGRERVCCASADFLEKGQSIITLAHLLKKEVGESLKRQLGKLPSDKARIRYIAEQTAEITGLHDFPQYLTLLFEIDSLILNDDRHLNNIAVLEQDGAYDYCPIFDNGAGLLSNMQAYSLGIEPAGLIPSIMSRPFNISFSRQMSTVQRLYGAQLKLPRFTRADIEQLLAPLLEYYPKPLRGFISDRVMCCIVTRQKCLGKSTNTCSHTLRPPL